MNGFKRLEGWTWVGSQSRAPFSLSSFQCSQQRDYVLLAIRTPPKEDGGENNATYHSNLSSIDEEWITEHVDHVINSLLYLVWY